MMVPKETTLSDWADSLVVDFPQDNIPFLSEEEDWRTWGNNLIQERSFEENGAPGTATFKDWRSWAEAVFFTMSNF